MQADEKTYQKFTIQSSPSYAASYYRILESNQLSNTVIGSFRYFPLVISLKMPQLDFEGVNYFAYSNIQPERIQSVNLRPIKKIIISNGQSFELEAAYGLGVKDDKVKDADDQKLCVVCLTNNKDVLNKPCRHVCLCQECARHLMGTKDNKCPNCRQVITDIQIFSI